MNTRRIAPLALAALLLVTAASLTSCTPGTTAVAAARQQIGQPYRTGGESRAEGGFDCSGLTSYAWRQAGYALPRSSSAQYSATTRVRRENLRAGDLVFYSSSGTGGRITHVALFAGGDTIVHARKPGVPLREDRLSTWWTGHLVGYGRVPASAKI